MIGALKIWLSKTIANLFPIPLEVALPNFLDPTLSKLNVTTVSLEVSSTLTPASTRLSPFIIILLLTIAISDPSSKDNFSVPNDSSLLSVIN